MTSKNSIYKMTVEHLRHSSWMIALSFIGNLIAGPIGLLFAFSNNDYTYYAQKSTAAQLLLVKSRDVSSYLGVLCSSMFLGVAMIGALIVALGIFYYLFQSSKIDLYHSLPLTRNELFYSGYLAGFIIWFVPFIISSIIALPLAFICAGGITHINMILVGFLKMLVFPLIGFIIMYHLCLLGVMLSGNMSNAIVTILVFGLAPITFYGLFTVHFQQYFDTFYRSAMDVFVTSAFSPIATPIVIQCIQIQIDEVPLTQMVFQIVVGLVIATLNFFVTRALYKNRKSELAGRGMENKISSFLIRFTGSFAAGLFGVLFLFITGISRNHVIWSLSFCLFFSCLASAVLSAIQKKTVKGLFAHKAQMLASMMLAAAFILICRFDILGYDTYLPKKDNIDSIEIRINAVSNYYYYHYGADQEFYKSKDTDIIYDLLQAGVEESSHPYATNIIVKVNPKIGPSYYRSYQVHTDKVETLRPIIEDKEFFDFLYAPYAENISNLESMYISDLNHNSFDVVNPEQMKAVWQAYYADLLDHSSMEEITEYANIGHIEYRVNDKDSNYYLPTLDISTNHERTIALLKEYYPHLSFDKNDLDVVAFHTSFGLREEQSLEEYYLEDLTPSSPDYLTDAVEENLKHAEATIMETYEYSCRLEGEELAWLYNYIIPCRHVEDRLNADNYTYVGELELRSGHSLSCHIKKGSMTEEEIKTFAAMVEEHGTITTY